MTYWFAGADKVGNGSAYTLASSDTLFVVADVNIGSDAGSAGVAGADFNALYIYGNVLSSADDGIHLTGGTNFFTVGPYASVTGGLAAIVVDGGANSLVNDGTIGGVAGIYLDGGSNMIVNTGHISASDGTAIGASGGGNYIANEGTIVSSAYNAIGISSLNGDSENTVDNSGYLAAGSGFSAVVTGDGPTVVTNTGTIVGNIQFGGGVDVYDGTVGTISGTVLGAGGDDELFGGAGRDRFTGGAGSDFMDGGAGRDRFIIVTATELGGLVHDTVAAFDAQRDQFDLGSTVTELMRR